MRMTDFRTLVLPRFYFRAWWIHKTIRLEFNLLNAFRIRMDYLLLIAKATSRTNSGPL
jgi:hypothetical protein